MNETRVAPKPGWLARLTARLHRKPQPWVATGSAEWWNRRAPKHIRDRVEAHMEALLPLPTDTEMKVWDYGVPNGMVFPPEDEAEALLVPERD